MPQSGQDPGYYNYCVNCGEPRYPGAAFCSGCGSSLTISALASTPVPDPIPVSYPTGEPVHRIPDEPSTHLGRTHEPHSSWSTIPVATQWTALANPLQIGSRTAPLDAWIVIACAALNIAIFGWWTIEALRVVFSGLGGITGEYAALGFLLSLLMTVYAVVLGAVCVLYALIGFGLLRKDPVAPWLAAVLGSVFVVVILVAHPSGLTTIALLVTNSAFAVLSAFSPGIRAYVDQGDPREPPTSVSAAVALARWSAFYLTVNGLILVITFVQAVASDYPADSWALFVGVLLLIGAWIVVGAGSRVIGGDPRARMTVSVIVSVAAVLRLTVDAGTSTVDFGTWIQVGLGVMTLVLLWLVPASSAYLDPRRAVTG